MPCSRALRSFKSDCFKERNWFLWNSVRYLHNRLLERGIRNLIVRLEEPGWDERNLLAELAEEVITVAEILACSLAYAFMSLADRILQNELLTSSFNTKKLADNDRQQLILMTTQSMSADSTMYSKRRVAS